MFSIMIISLDRKELYDQDAHKKSGNSRVHLTQLLKHDPTVLSLKQTVLDPERCNKFIVNKKRKS